jgi:hypothetical protein
LEIQFVIIVKFFNQLSGKLRKKLFVGLFSPIPFVDNLRRIENFLKK